MPHDLYNDALSLYHDMSHIAANLQCQPVWYEPAVVVQSALLVKIIDMS